MNRTLLAASLLLGATVPLRAQAPQMLADSTVIRAAALRQWTVTSIPQGWRDSVAIGWSNNFTGTSFRPAQPLIPEMRAELALQLMRNGDLRRVKVLRTSGDPAFDSVLIATSWAADRALAFPRFSHQMEGAGTEVILEVWSPLAPGRAPTSTSRGNAGGVPAAELGAWNLTAIEIPAMTPVCDSILTLPTSYPAMTLRARLDSVAGDEGRREWAARALTAMQTEFHPTGGFAPTRRTRIIFGGGSDPRLSEVRVSALLRFQVDSTGHLTSAEMVIPTGYPALDSTLIEMVRTADSAGTIPPPPPGAATNSVDVVVTTDRGATQVGVPLGIVHLGIWSAERLPTLKTMGPMRYPEGLRSAGASGRVTLEFLVGPTGDPVPGSIRIISSAHPEFSLATSRMLYGAKFTPGVARGCAVTTAVRQSVNFRR